MKKKVLFMTVFAFIAMFSVKMNVFAGDIECPILPGVKIDTSIVDIVSMIIKVIQIAVPILLVIFGSIDLVKGVTSQKEDEIKKGQQIFIKRLIAGVLVFFVIAIVKLVISAVTSDDNDVMQCVNCFLNGTDSSSCNAN